MWGWQWIPLQAEPYTVTHNHPYLLLCGWNMWFGIVILWAIYNNRTISANGWPTPGWSDINFVWLISCFHQSSVFDIPTVWCTQSTQRRGEQRTALLSSRSWLLSRPLYFAIRDAVDSTTPLNSSRVQWPRPGTCSAAPHPCPFPVT